MNAPAKIEAAKADEPVGLDLLRAPFPPHLISKLPKETKSQIEARKANKSLMVWECPECGGAHHKDAIHLDYVGHAALTDRLLDADPLWNWEPMAFTDDGLPAFDRTGGLWIKLTVCGQTRLGYGHAASKPNQDPGAREKEVIGDALRNAAMRFGAALDLWHKGDLHADDADDENGQQRQSDNRSAEPRQQSKPSGGMSDASFAKITQLLQATNTPVGAMLDNYKVKQVRDLTKVQFDDAVEYLEGLLARMAKAESNDRAAPADGFGDIEADSIPF